MLDIPETVKNLFDQDSVRKNFRAVFESGLVVTNADITWNSLRFRESVCSADSVTFGAAEASVLNFETRGVRNMLGEWFEAWMEIDATTLPAELQTEREDLDYPVYPVPLGRFVVTACPRNHEAMTKRKVTAMSNLDADIAITSGPLAAIMSANYRYSGGRSPTSVHLALGRALPAMRFPDNAPEESISVVTEVHRSWNPIIPSTIYVPGSVSGRLQLVYGPSYSPLYVYSVSVSVALSGSQIQAHPRNTAYRFTHPGPPDDVDIDRIVTGIAAKLWAVHPGFIARNSSETVRFSGPDDPVLLEKLRAWVIDNNIFGLSLTNESVSVDYPNRIQTNDFIGHFSPVPTADAARDSGFTLSARYALAASNTAGPEDIIFAVTDSFREDHPTLDAKIEAVDPAATGDPLDNVTIILEASEALLGRPYTEVSYSFDPAELSMIANAMIELSGSFGCFRRAGGQKYLKQLDQEPVMQISRGQLSSAWWDEFDLAPVGSIAYRLAGEDYVYAFGEGQSQYVFQNSDIFDKIQDCTTDMVQAMMDEHLVPALQNLTFTPAEISSLGFPHLEAGDCIELEAEDGSIIKTYVLERELHGTQHLTDRITADGITITEVDL